MDSSVNFRSRKRKQSSASNPLNGRFTRSKSQIHVHRSRSGRAWPDSPAGQPFHKAQLMQDKPLQKPRNVRHPLPENGASLDLSIKDLRTRARRVFSPPSVVEEEGGQFDVGIEFAEEGCNGTSKVVDNCEKLELGIADSDLRAKNSDMDSELGFAFSDKEEHGCREDVGSVSKDEDPVLGLGSHGPPDKEDDMNLNEKTPEMEKRNEGNKVESGKDCSESKRNGSISGSRSVINPSSKRKVFKAPGSISYRRLLPFLMEMTNDDSSTSKIDAVAIGYPCKVQNLNIVNSSFSSALTGCYAGKCKRTDDHSDHIKTSVEGDYQNSGIQLPFKGQDLDDPTKKMGKTEGTVGLSNVEQRNHENGMNGVNELIEEFVQTTPPDDTIISKLDNNNSGVARDLNAPQSGNHVLERASNVDNASNGISISMKFHPARKSNTISNAKLVLNPCSQSKIFKTSSFSYRRLLPFLTDVAKSTANIDERPKFQTEEGDNHSLSKESVDDNILVNRTRTDDFPDNQDAEEQEPFARPVNPPTSGSSDHINPNISSSIDSLLIKKSNTSSSEAIAKPDMPFLEGTSQNELVISDSSLNLETELAINNFKSCHSEVNCSSETSGSTINYESLAKESKSKVSQVPEHAQTDVGKECMALGLDYHKDKLQLIKSVSQLQSSLAIEEFHHKGNQSDSPSKGILMRNPRGCRGLCNCLNCSSFRLHAERSFEFSKNQMLDAEEVAQRLINELAELRNLLEKSVFGGNDLVPIQINQLQAKEAYERSLKTEQLARGHLSQMKDDLKIHCRIRPLQRPRVTFSRYIEEIAVPKTNISASPNFPKK